MRRGLAVALALFAAACAQSKPVAAPQPAPAPPLTMPRPLPGTTVPYNSDISGALYTMAAECEPGEQPDCPDAAVSVGIHDSRCIATAPEDGQASATCRVDWTETKHPPRPLVVHRDECIRFILLDVEGSNAKLWAVRYTPPRHRCEVPAQ